MRENRPYGLEGGESGSTGLPYPYLKSRNRIVVKLLFPYATGRRSTTGLLEQMP